MNNNITRSRKMVFDAPDEERKRDITFACTNQLLNDML